MILAEAGTSRIPLRLFERLTLVFSSGKDATEAFEDVGHSDEARALLPDMLVGPLDGSVRPLLSFLFRFLSH